MDDVTQRRIAANESRYRALNERQVDATSTFRSGNSDAFTIACECAIDGCEQMLLVSPDTYERVRREPTRFLVAPDHIAPAAERVVERIAGVWVVEKVGAGAQVARERA